MAGDIDNADLGAGKRMPIMVKKCPYCSATLSLAENVCPSCKNKVGDPDADGIAKIPGRWKNWIWFIIAFGIMIGYFYWAFVM